MLRDKTKHDKTKHISRVRRAASLARRTHGAGPGRPRSKDRCPCGAMTRQRAELRHHRC